ncbi:MAG TPA: oligogalacturonate lyase family protein [Pyrinomonadaceae bacterium]|jgi:oligogalacturonide lyase|nr:oligogalacturonate lyase family protein [Pyrinomonadaceae bacterium]
MKRIFSTFLLIILAALILQAQDPPREWVDQDTGHRVVRLSDEPGSSSFYFHQNGYTASGDKLVFSTRSGLSTYDFKTKKIEQIVEGRAGNAIVGPKTRKVFYLKGDTVYETDIDTKATREIARDARLRSGSGFAVNADETLLGGSMVTGDVPKEFRPSAPPPAPNAQPQASPTPRGDNYPGKGEMMERRLAAKIPMALYTVNIKTGAVKTFHPATDWLNHVQFSPTDPTLMMFCHEGPWHKVDRIWTIRTDGSDLKKIHTRTMDMEIAGHEFFGRDGNIYYDLQTPKSQVFWLAEYNVKTGKLTKYSLEKHEWSVHYNVSPDGKLFAGDGGGPNSVARGDNGQWIYLFRPENGKLKAEKLVNLAKHDYRLEPNVTFTPDGKWIVFRSNMFGPTQVYAVEVKKAG